MTLSRDTRGAFLAELDRIYPGLAEAFAQWVQDARGSVQASVVEEALKNGDVEFAVQYLVRAITEPQYFSALDRQISEAFYSGGVWQLSTIPKSVSTGSPGRALVVRFSGRHPRAEAWARDRSAALITEITVDMETVIRETIAEAIEESRPYRKVTRELIGTTEGNQRKGGLIGLHSRQARAVRNARADLEALDARYFTRKRRDKRFDGMVRRAIAEGKPLSAADVTKITGRYSERLLRLRGETISRTEGNKAMNAGRSEGIVQMIERGEILAEHVTIIWDATPGPRTRDSHRALNGQTIKWGEFFVSPVTGALMRWPHDEDAPAAETVNCRCSARLRVDWKAVMQWRRQMAGEAA